MKEEGSERKKEEEVEALEAAETGRKDGERKERMEVEKMDRNGTGRERKG